MPHRCLFLLLGALTGLSACAQMPLVPIPVEPMPLKEQTRLPAPLRPNREVVTASGWNFDQDVCLARTGGKALSVAIRGGDEEVQITLNHERNVWQHRQARLAYRGRAGRWEAIGRVKSLRELTVASPINEQSVSRALILLAGGTLTAQSSLHYPIELRVPPGGRDGQNWFECLKRRLMP